MRLKVGSITCKSTPFSRTHLRFQSSEIRFISTTMKRYQEVEAKDYEKWSKRQLINKLTELSRSVTPLEGKAVENGQANGDITEQPPLKKSKKKQMVFTDENTRLIGLKFSYAGWGYQGLAVQKEETQLPTVEQKILEALHHIKVIPTVDVNDCNFSRCGRTDKGVSAMNQVISLKARSNLSKEERLDPANDVRELDYVNILNQILPADIRMHAVCLRPPRGFDARFSCRSRHYKYIFDSTGLDIDAMNQAAKKFEGVHDFRNFCKVDGGKQITNFERQIFSSQIIPLDASKKSKFFVFDLKGRAFLWHQVRCMVATLLMVGQSLEKPEIIDYLLDIERCPKKPQYIMAHDVPLVLYDCEFADNVKWTPPALTTKTQRANCFFGGHQLDYNLKSIIFDLMHDIAIKPFDQDLGDKLLLNHGDGKGRFANKNIALKDRDTIGTPEEINEKWRQKNPKKFTKLEVDDGDE